VVPALEVSNSPEPRTVQDDFTKQIDGSRVFHGVTPKELELNEAKFPGGVLNFGKSQIEHSDGIISPLLPAEARLLRYLFEHPGQVVTRDDLVRDVWKLDPRGTSTRVMDVQIGKIRRKLRDSDGKLIETVRGHGYRLCL
jgi:DNA-binding response OmpR family regulator